MNRQDDWKIKQEIEDKDYQIIINTLEPLAEDDYGYYELYVYDFELGNIYKGLEDREVEFIKINKTYFNKRNIVSIEFNKIPKE